LNQTRQHLGRARVTFSGIGYKPELFRAFRKLAHAVNQTLDERNTGHPTEQVSAQQLLFEPNRRPLLVILLAKLISQKAVPRLAYSVHVDLRFQDSGRGGGS
jgi:hypothetical protein